MGALKFPDGAPGPEKWRLECFVQAAANDPFDDVPLEKAVNESFPGHFYERIRPN
jgi:hypothetical protein